MRGGSIHTVAKIIAAPDSKTQVGLLGENIMIYIKEFGSKNMDREIISNEYITRFVESLRTELNY